MNLIRIGALLILVTVGCASQFPQSSLTGKVFQVKIRSLSPQVVTVQQGDEVRWINTRSGPVDIPFESRRVSSLVERGLFLPDGGICSSAGTRIPRDRDGA